jgi:hypothetical protein
MDSGVLSSDYVAYNNGQVTETLHDLLTNAAVSVRSFLLEETQLFLKVASEDIVDRDSGLKARVMIANSEVGIGSVSVEPLSYSDGQ